MNQKPRYRVIVMSSDTQKKQFPNEDFILQIKMRFKKWAVITRQPNQINYFINIS